MGAVKDAAIAMAEQLERDFGVDFDAAMTLILSEPNDYPGRARTVLEPIV